MRGATAAPPIGPKKKKGKMCFQQYRYMVC